MVESRVQCPACGGRIAYRYDTRWECGSCGRKYGCVQGVPKLYLEECLGKADKDLRDRVYNGIAGRFYKFMMPFLTIPARPIRITLRHWLVYFLLILILGFLVYHCGEWVFLRGLGGANWVDLLLSVALGAYVLFLWKHPYVAYLLLLAVPVKISLAMRPFQPLRSFSSVHAQFQEEYRGAAERVKLLDVATGTCNSLFKHGWMALNAEYTAVDLSESMLLQGRKLMETNIVPVDFMLCDAAKLPFEAETFDIVTSYGAVNGYTDPKRALEEMVRVTKKGGKVLFLDEQLYESASWLERTYFQHVLSFQDTIDRCPVELLPEQLEDVQVHQVYHFYYICTARKRHE